MTPPAHNTPEYTEQITFRKALEKNFPEIFEDVMATSFQDGWKKATGVPKHGCHNPNYRDIGLFLNRVIELGLHEKFECPDLPFRGLDDRRGEYSEADFWLLQAELCKIYSYVSSFHRACKRDGLIDRLYNDRLIQPRDNNYEVLRDTALSWIK
jgi:hypothetical protein